MYIVMLHFLAMYLLWSPSGPGHDLSPSFANMSNVRCLWRSRGVAANGPGIDVNLLAKCGKNNNTGPSLGLRPANERRRYK